VTELLVAHRLEELTGSPSAPRSPNHGEGGVLDVLEADFTAVGGSSFKTGVWGSVRGPVQ
jgi:hypothetical protein